MCDCADLDDFYEVVLDLTKEGGQVSTFCISKPIFNMICLTGKDMC